MRFNSHTQSPRVITCSADYFQSADCFKSSLWRLIKVVEQGGTACVKLKLNEQKTQTISGILNSSKVASVFVLLILQHLDQQ